MWLPALANLPGPKPPAARVRRERGSTDRTKGLTPLDRRWAHAHGISDNQMRELLRPGGGLEQITSK